MTIWDELDELVQEVYEGLGVDLEHGSHLWNSWAWDEFQRKHKYLTQAIVKLDNYISTHREANNEERSGN